MEVISKRRAREWVKNFETPLVRRSEELFAKLFTNSNDLKLYFINESTSYTDGSTIVINPSFLNMFCDERAMRACELYLGLPDNFLTGDKFMALRMITRGLTIHEALHLIYSDFSSSGTTSQVPKSDNEREVLAAINNIIEDAYIESVGASLYDNLSTFLMLVRIGMYYSKEDEKNSRILERKCFNHTEEEPINSGRFCIGLLNYFTVYMLFPFGATEEPPRQVAEYVDRVKGLFLAAAQTPNPELRAKYGEQILVELRPLIPPEEKPLDLSRLKSRMINPNTHIRPGGSGRDNQKKRKGKPQPVSNSLFGRKYTNPIPKEDSEDSPSNESERDNPTSSGSPQNGEDGPESENKTDADSNDSLSSEEQRRKKKAIDDILNSHKEKLKEMLEKFRKENHVPLSPQLRETMLDFSEEKKDNEYGQDYKENRKDHEVVILPTSLNAPKCHNDIKITQKRYVSDKSMREKYEEVRLAHKHVIGLYKQRFNELLKTQVDYHEQRYLFGSGIDSKRLSDPQRRYWYRNRTEDNTPELSVLLIIDGSGSMVGSPRLNCRDSSIILHEVLESQGVRHAVVEHRGQGYDPGIEIDLLLGFDAQSTDRFNLLRTNAYGDNRDGLALLWGENYISRMTDTENKLIIILSDGLPAHAYDNYYPPASVEDTKLIVRQIQKRGVKVLGIDLNPEANSSGAYNLSQIYPNLISCEDLQTLPTQLLTAISKELI